MSVEKPIAAVTSVKAPECCVNYPYPNMAPGQIPYTCADLAQVYDLVADAANDDPGEDNEEI